MIRVLTFTTLYPNAVQPQHGIFVENRIRHLAESGEVAIDVVAPVPWFPFAAAAFGQYAVYGRAPRHETRHGIAVAHPRFPVLPRIGMNVAPLLLYAAMKPVLARRLASGRHFDLIDAHYFYPDGVAAAMLARAFHKPVVITARGSDLNVLPNYAQPRRRILQAAAQADAIVTVCEDLQHKLTDLGGKPKRLRVLRNGVALDVFSPRDRASERTRLGLGGTTLLCVGNLIPLKGQDLVIRALAELPAAALLIAGDGPERASLAALARRLGVAERVRFLGRVAHAELPAIYSAADVTVLASTSEGWANVLLESMACGTPVVATAVGGSPEVVTDPVAGILIQERSVSAIAEAVRQLFADPPDRRATRAYAEQFDWQATTEGQLALFREIVAAGRQPLTPAFGTAPGTAGS